MNEKKEELYQMIRHARMNADNYWKRADEVKSEERANRLVRKAEESEVEEATLIKVLGVIFGETKEDVDKFIRDYELGVLQDLIAGVRSYVMAHRHDKSIDNPMAILAYENMVFYATDRELNTKEYQICKHNFEITFKKELSKRGEK